MRWECWTASVRGPIDNSKQKTGTVKALGMGPCPLPNLPLICHVAFLPCSLVFEAQVSYSRNALAVCGVEWGELQHSAEKTPM